MPRGLRHLLDISLFLWQYGKHLRINQLNDSSLHSSGLIFSSSERASLIVRQNLSDCGAVYEALSFRRAWTGQAWCAAEVPLVLQGTNESAVRIRIAVLVGNMGSIWKKTYISSTIVHFYVDATNRNPGCGQLPCHADTSYKLAYLPSFLCGD